MSMGTRIARQGHAKVRATFSTTKFQEPLLFLYPAWARKSSTTVALPREYTCIETLAPIPSFPKSKGDNFSNTASAGGQAETKSPQIKRRPAITKYDLRSQRRRNQTDKRVEANNEFKFNSKIRRIVSHYHRLDEAKERTSEARQAWQTKRNEISGREWFPDWRTILQTLIRATPDHGDWLVDAIAVKVSKESALRLLNGLDDNLWQITSAHDCVARLGSRDGGDDVHRKFVLSGSAVSISRVTAQLSRIAPEMVIARSANLLRLSDITASGAFGLAKNKQGLTRYGIVGPPPIPFGPDGAIPKRPLELNTDSFYQYVRELTRNEVSNHLHRFLHQKPEQHVRIVRKILWELFQDQKYKPYVTSMAIREAITYLTRTNIISDARALFNTHSAIDSETFNMMLHFPADINDLYNFKYILDLMIRKGFHPTRGTWMQFLQANSNNLGIQLRILSAMTAKGLVQTPSALQDVYKIVAVKEAESALATSSSPASLVKAVDSSFGPDWLTLDAAKRILRLLGSKGLLSECSQFLHIMVSRSVKPDASSVNTVLYMYKQGRDLRGAINMLKGLPEGCNFIPNEDTYRGLFEMAWRSRSYNVARVVWKHACLSHNAVFRMRSLIKASLMRNPTTLDALSPRNRFSTLAGPFIIQWCQGIGDRRASISQQPSKPDSQGFTDVVADTIVHKDMGLFLNWEPLEPFVQMLEEAFEMDEAWKSEEAATKKKKSPKWMFQNGIRVLLRPLKKDLPLIGPGDNLSNT